MKASVPMRVIPSGSSTFFSLRHDVNMVSEISVTPLPILISSSSLQYLNALSPMVVTLSGMMIDFRLILLWNASGAILVTESGIVRYFMLPGIMPPEMYLTFSPIIKSSSAGQAPKPFSASHSGAL